MDLNYEFSKLHHFTNTSVEPAAIGLRPTSYRLEIQCVIPIITMRNNHNIHDDAITSMWLVIKPHSVCIHCVHCVKIP